MASSAVVNVLRVILDVLMLLLVALPSIIFSLGHIQPTQRGFFCDDESIRYPYNKSTISTIALILVSGFTTVVIVIICEILNYLHVNRRRSTITAEPLPNNIKVNPCLYAIIGYIWAFGFGMMVNQGFTDVGKWTIGRLRPHFIQGCMPANLSWIENCEVGQYIEGINCTQPDHEIFKDLRLSFPSGHASLSAYAMVFLAYYIQKRVPRFAYSYLFKNVLQCICVLMAWYCALSRVMDFKHHPTDVLAGSILGTIIALLICRYVTEGFRDPYNHGRYPRVGDKNLSRSRSNTNVEEGAGNSHTDASLMENANKSNV